MKLVIMKCSPYLIHKVLNFTLAIALVVFKIETQSMNFLLCTYIFIVSYSNIHTINHVWDLKDANIPFNTKWSILAKASSFNPITGKCRLCLKEVYYILFKPETASLNSRIEAFGYCQHKKQWALEKT